MNELAEIQKLVKEIADQLSSGGKAEKRNAAVKLDRIVALASTLALTIRVHG